MVITFGQHVGDVQAFFAWENLHPEGGFEDMRQLRLIIYICQGCSLVFIKHILTVIIHAFAAAACGG